MPGGHQLSLANFSFCHLYSWKRSISGGTLINRPGKKVSSSPSSLSAEVFNHFLVRTRIAGTRTRLPSTFACIPPPPREVGDERRRRISFSRVIRTLKLPRSNSTVIALFCSLKATGPPLCIPSLARLKACARPINRERRGTRPRIGPRNLEQLSN